MKLKVIFSVISMLCCFVSTCFALESGVYQQMNDSGYIVKKAIVIKAQGGEKSLNYIFLSNVNSGINYSAVIAEDSSGNAVSGPALITYGDDYDKLIHGDGFISGDRRNYDGKASEFSILNNSDRIEVKSSFPFVQEFDLDGVYVKDNRYRFNVPPAMAVLILETMPGSFTHPDFRHAYKLNSANEGTKYYIDVTENGRDFGYFEMSTTLDFVNLIYDMGNRTRELFIKQN